MSYPEGLSVSGREIGAPPSVAVVIEGAQPAPTGITLTGGPGPRGPEGPQGPPARWQGMTRAEYETLNPPDPDTLYVILTVAPGEIRPPHRWQALTRAQFEALDPPDARTLYVITG